MKKKNNGLLHKESALKEIRSMMQLE